ncbi:MAG: acyltransferase [Gammaproteobacteria bacterium]|nr:acyltransferase [Gammaproteobacteria bacterium]
MRLVSFDYLRGIAIVFIVAGHSYGGWVIDSFSEKVIVNIVSGGTTLFVFISGFFFHHIFYKDFELKDFMIKKAKNVLAPYLILSSLGFAYFAVSSEPFPFQSLLISSDISTWYDALQLYASYLWTGRIMYAYWYIPFIMIMFLLSPFFMRYIRLALVPRLTIMLVLLVFSAFFVHRPVLNLSPLHSVIYFIPVYLLGINCSINRNEFEQLLKGKTLILAIIVLILSALQSAYFDSRGNVYKHDLLSYAIFDINLFQKIAVCFFFISLLHRYQHKTIPGLKLLASSSFAIYFLHTWILHITDQYPLFFLFANIPQIVIWLSITVGVTGLCMVVAYCVKSLLKHTSRYVIGW